MIGGKMRFLLVDDNPVKLELLGELLRKELPDSEVVVVENGPKALRLAARESFDVAFVDVQMPGMDGLEVCRRLKGNPRTSGIHVVLITAHQADSDLRIAGLDAGAFDFITQPIRNAELMARLRSLLRVKLLEERLADEANGLQRQVAQQAATLNWLTGLFSFASDNNNPAVAADLTRLLARTDPTSSPERALLDSDLFQRIPSDLRKALLHIALFDFLPLPLAALVVPVPNCDELLGYLKRHSFLEEAILDGLKVVCFCPELKAFFRKLALSELCPSERRAAFEAAVGWYCRQQRSRLALLTALSAGEVELAEQVCSQALGSFLLKGVLPVEELQRWCDQELPLGSGGWLQCAVALAIQVRDPAACLGMLQLAADLLSRQSDHSGELLVAGLLLEQALLLDVDRDSIVRQLGKILELRVEVASLEESFIVGYISDLIILCDSMAVETGVCVPQALSALTGERIRGGAAVTPWGRLAALRRAISRGESHDALQLLEKGCGLTGDSGKLLGVRWDLLAGEFMLLRGEPEAAHELVSALYAGFPRYWLVQTTLGMALRLFEVEILFAMDDRSAALDAVRHSGWGKLRAIPETLWMERLVEFGGGEVDGRPDSGAPAGIPTDGERLLLLAAAVGRATDRKGLAELCYDKVLTETSSRTPLAVAAAHLGHVLLAGKEAVAGPGHLAEGLEFMKRSEYHYLPYLSPQARLQICRAGVKGKFAPEFCRNLARNAFGAELADDGEPRPVLEINVLGPLRVGWRQGPFLKGDDLTSGLRQLLAMLVLAPGHRLPQEQVQLAFWPDSPQAQARSKLDSLVLRLRRCLESVLGVDAAKDHLRLQKGILSLDGVVVDMVAFRERVRTGLRRIRRRETWQGIIDLKAAHRLWRGPFCLELPDGAFGMHLLEDLMLLLTDSCLALQKVFLDRGDVAAAKKALRFGLKFDPCQDELVRELLGIYRERGQNVRLAALCSDYEKALLAQGFSREEARESVEDLRQGRPM